MRPRLEIHCGGVPMIWVEDLRTDDTDTISFAISIGDQTRYFTWPTDGDGQPVNPWGLCTIIARNHPYSDAS